MQDFSVQLQQLQATKDRHRSSAAPITVGSVAFQPDEPDTRTGSRIQLVVVAQSPPQDPQQVLSCWRRIHTSYLQAEPLQLWGTGQAKKPGKEQLQVLTPTPLLDPLRGQEALPLRWLLLLFQAEP